MYLLNSFKVNKHNFCKEVHHYKENIQVFPPSPSTLFSVHCKYLYASPVLILILLLFLQCLLYDSNTSQKHNILACKSLYSMNIMLRMRRGIIRAKFFFRQDFSSSKG